MSITQNATIISPTIFAGAVNGTTVQTVTDLTGATGITANKVFTGNISISAAASQIAALAAAGTLNVNVTWVAGSGGTASQRVASVNLLFGVGSVTNLTAPLAFNSIIVPVQLYVGTTTGKFQYTVATTGTISTMAWDIIVTGTAN